MTEQERDALLDLWEKVPETRPVYNSACIHWTCGGWWHGDHADVPVTLVAALVKMIEECWEGEVAR